MLKHHKYLDDCDVVEILNSTITIELSGRTNYFKSKWLYYLDIHKINLDKQLFSFNHSDSPYSIYLYDWIKRCEIIEDFDPHKYYIIKIENGKLTSFKSQDERYESTNFILEKLMITTPMDRNITYGTPQILKFK